MDAAKRSRKTKPGRFPLLLANIEVTFILYYFSGVDVTNTQMYQRIITGTKKNSNTHPISMLGS